METRELRANTAKEIIVDGKVIGEVTQHGRESLAAICFGDMPQAGLSFADWGKNDEEAIKNAVALGRKKLRVLVKELNWLKSREVELFED